MLTVCKGVYKIRIRTEGTSRILYVAVRGSNLHPTHILETTQEATKHDLQLDRAKYHEMMKHPESLIQEENSDG
jgi:phage-related protein